MEKEASMAERVGIVAVAQTKYSPNRADANEGELVYEAIKQVLQETGLKFAQDGTGIDASVTCSQDFWDGRTISSCNVMSYVGAHHSDEDKVAEDSLNAVYTAFARILSGHQDIVLVATHCKESQGDKRGIENAALDPIFLRVLGLDFLSAAALQARRYMYKYGITPEQCAKVAVKNRGNARKNPFAQEPLDITVEEVLGSQVLASPIRQLDTKPTSDGACAMILAREEKARKLTSKPVWILGASNCYETHYLGDRDLAECDGLVAAAKKAYKMAGIKDPMKQIDVAEISEEYSYQELLWMEGLGFCPRGEAGKVIDGGVTQMGGRLPVNPSGGMLSGNPTVVAGMTRVAEAVLQLRGEAGDRQVTGAKRALAHGFTGVCGQLQGVMILGNS
jgi:acetyl-CoA C-acetyltransferase